MTKNLEVAAGAEIAWFLAQCFQPAMHTERGLTVRFSGLAL